MANGKHHRPIDLYEEQFEDKNKEQFEDFRGSIIDQQHRGPNERKEADKARDIRLSSIAENIPVHPEVRDAYNKLQETSGRDRLLANIKESGILEGVGQTQEDAYDKDSLEGVEALEKGLFSENLWNTLYNMIDEIQAERFNGKIRDAKKEIRKLEETVARGSKLEGGALTEEDIAAINEEKEEWNTVIEENRADITENQLEIDGQEVSRSYEAYTNYLAQEEGSSYASYAGAVLPFMNERAAGGEIAKDLGGALSDITAMAVSFAAPIIGLKVGTAIGAGISAATAAGAVTTPTGPGAGVFAAVGFTAGMLTSFGTQWYMRENESYAEAEGAYEEKYNKIRDDFIYTNKRLPTEQEEAKMSLDAEKGFDSILAQNKGLYMYDLVEAGLMALPWGRSLKWLTAAQKYKRALARTGLAGGGLFLGSINESREEGNQFLYKKDYISGKFDEDAIGRINFWDLATLSRGGSTIIGRGFDYDMETIAAMPDVLMPGWKDQIANYAPGRTNNPEFRNSMRAGFLMGGMMGGGIGLAEGAYGTSMRTRDRYIYGQELKEINPFLDQYIKDEQLRSKAYQYFNGFEDGRFKRMYKAIKNLDNLNLRPEEGENINIEKELKTIQEMKNLYDYIQNQEDFAKMSKEDRADLFYTFIKVDGFRKTAEEDYEKSVSALNDAYSDLDLAGIEKPTEFLEALKLKHKKYALKERIDYYKTFRKSDTFKNLPDVEKRLWFEKSQVAIAEKGVLIKAFEEVSKLYDEYTKDNNISKRSLRILGEDKLELGAQRVEENNLIQYFHNLEYASLRNPNNAAHLKTNARFKETQYFKKKGEKVIEAENLDFKEVTNSVDKPEGTPLTPKTKVKMVHPTKNTLTGIINGDGQKIVNADTEDVRSIKELERDGYEIIPIETEKTYAETVKTTKDKVDAANNSEGIEKTSDKVDEEVLGNPDVQNDSSNKETENSTEENQSYIDLSGMNVSGQDLHQTEEEQTISQADLKKEGEAQAQKDREAPIVPETENYKHKVVGQYMDKKGSWYILPGKEQIPNWLAAHPEKDIIENYAVKYELNLDYLDKILADPKKFPKQGMLTLPGVNALRNYLLKIRDASKSNNWEGVDVNEKVKDEYKTAKAPDIEMSFAGWVPINANVIKNGKNLIFGKQQIVLQLHNNQWNTLYTEAENTLLELRSRVLEKFSRNEGAYGRINSLDQGIPNSKVNGKFSIAKLFAASGQKPVIGISEDGNINVNKKDYRGRLSDSKSTGAPYALVPTANGKTYPLQLGYKDEKGNFHFANRKLNDREADILYEIAKRIALSGQGANLQFTLSNTFIHDDFKNLTASNILSLLIQRGKLEEGFPLKDFFGFDFKAKTVTVGVNNKGDAYNIPFSQIATSGLRIKQQLKDNFYRNVQATGLGEDLFEMEMLSGQKRVDGSGEIVFFGETFKQGQSPYNYAILKIDKEGDESVLTTDALVNKNGSAFGRNQIFLSNTVTSINPQTTGTTTVPNSNIELTPEQIDTIETIRAESKLMRLTKDENNYYKVDVNGEPIRDEKGDIILYQRVSNYLSPDKPPDIPLVTTSLNIGNLVDEIVRDFFTGNLKPYIEYGEVGKVIEGMQVPGVESESQFNTFIGKLTALKQEMESRGEVVVTGATKAEEIKVFNDDLLIAGTLDLLTVAPDGTVRIYDVKTLRNEKDLTVQYTDRDTGAKKPSKIQKWNRQLGTYRILLNSRYKLNAKEIIIIPVKVNYPEDGQIHFETSELKLLDRLSSAGSNPELQILDSIPNVGKDYKETLVMKVDDVPNKGTRLTIPGDNIVEIFFRKLFTRPETTKIFKMLRELFADTYATEHKESNKYKKRPSMYYGSTPYAYGQIGATSKYIRPAKEMPEALAKIVRKAEKMLGFSEGYFDMILLNEYEDGKGSISPHSDSEPVITDSGRVDPTVVTLSFGDTRTFILQKGRGAKKITIPVDEGSALTMGKRSQLDYLHSVAPEAEKGPRISITLRHNAQLAREQEEVITTAPVEESAPKGFSLEEIQQLFKENPELANFGTPEDYQKYLSTLFPESTVQEIVYHGTNKFFSIFDKELMGTSTGKSKTGEDFDSELMFSLTNSKDTAFNYATLGRQQELGRIISLLQSVQLGEATQEIINELKTIPEVNAFILQKKKEYKKLSTKEAGTQIIEDLKELGKKYGPLWELTRGGALSNPRSYLRELERGIKNLKDNKQNILNNKVYTPLLDYYRQNDTTFGLIKETVDATYTDIRKVPKGYRHYTTSVRIDKQGKIRIELKDPLTEKDFASLKALDKKFVTELTEKQFDDMIEAMQAMHDKNLADISKDLEKGGFTPQLLRVVVNLKNPIQQDFEGRPFVLQPGQQDKKTGGAQIQIIEIVKKAKKAKDTDGVILKNIADPHISTNYGIFEPEQAHILGTAKDAEAFKTFMGVGNISDPFADMDLEDGPVTMAAEQVSHTEPIMNEEEEINHIRRVLGNIIPINIVNDLIQIGKRGGGLAYGMFHKGMITLSKRAPKGVGYHEAYHVVEELYLTPEEITALNRDTEKEYGKPSQEEIDRVQSKWILRYGANISNDTATKIIYSERRAEDFRVYQLTKGKLKSLSAIANSFFKKLVDWIKNVFYSELTAARLFRNMDRGYYATRKPIENNLRHWYNSQVGLAMEISDFTEIQAANITNSLIYASILSTKGGIRAIEDPKDINISKEVLIAAIEGRKRAAIANNKPEKAALLDKVHLHLDLFIDNIKAELKKISIRETEESKKDMEIAKSKGNADITAQVKMHFESSGKDNAQTSTKILMSFVPLMHMNTKLGRAVATSDPTTGFPLLTNPAYLWNTTESLLAGIVNYRKDDGTEVFAMEEMLEKLNKYGQEVDPTFIGLVTTIENLSFNQQAAFYNAFSKTEISYITALYSDFTTGYKYKIFNSNVQSKANRIYNSWKSNFLHLGILFPQKQANGSYLYRVDINKLNEVLTKYKDFKDKDYKNITEAISKGHAIDIKVKSNFIELLKSVGIYIDLKSLDLAAEVRRKRDKLSDSKTGLLSVVDTIKELFEANPAKKRNAFLFRWLKDIWYTKYQIWIDAENVKQKKAGKPEKSLDIKALDKDNVLIDSDTRNPIGNFSKVLKELSAAHAIYDQDFGQNTILGPEGNTYWTFSLNNYLTKFTSELKKSGHAIKELLSIPFNTNSLWLNIGLADVVRNPKTKEIESVTLNKGNKNFTIDTFNNFKKQGGEDQGKKNVDIAPADNHSLRVNMSLDNIYSPPSFADKSVWYVYSGLDGALMEMFAGGFMLDSTGSIQIDPKIINIFRGYWYDEWTRVKRTHNQLFGPAKLEDYMLNRFYHYKEDSKGNKVREDGNGLKFMIFPSFNDKAKRKKLGLEIDDELNQNALSKNQEDAIDKEIASTMKLRIEEEIEFSVLNGVLKRSALGGLENGSIDIPKFTAYENKFVNVKNLKGKSPVATKKIYAAKNIIAEYTVGSMVANIESFKIYIGDPAFYASVEALLKRTPEIIAPGQDLMIGKGEEFFNIAVFMDVETNSKYLNDYKEAFREMYKDLAVDNPEVAKTDTEIDKILAPYTDFSLTDAQGYITLERWKFIMERLGKWKKKWNESYDRLAEGKGNAKDMTIIKAQPLKGMHYELMKRAGLGIAVPTYLKYSQAVLIPQLVLDDNGKVKNDLGNLLLAMREQGIDEVVSSEGIKVGAQSPINIVREEQATPTIKNYKDINFVKMTLQNKYWKLQQDLTPHESAETLEGSQVKRNILANIKQDKIYDIKGEKVTGAELIRKIHEVDILLSDIGVKKLFDEFGITAKIVSGSVLYTMINKTKLRDALIKNFESKDTTSDNLLKSLDLTEDGTEFKHGLDENEFWNELDSVLASILTKRTVKLDMPGGSFIQMSSFGLNQEHQMMTKVQKLSGLTKEQKEQIEYIPEIIKKPLQPPLFKKGSFRRGDILIPHWFKTMLPNKGMTGREIAKYVRDTNLLNVIGYRIPNQGMSSIDSLRVVGFLPESMGDTVVAYDEVTAKTGSDFDIDKMYIMRPNYRKVLIRTDKDKEGNDIKVYRPQYIEWAPKQTYEGGDIKMLQNRKLELYHAVLSNKYTFIEVVSPLDSLDIKYRAANVRFLEAYGKLTPAQIAEIENASEKDFPKVVAKYVQTLEDLKYVSPAYQMEVRRTFLGGQFGVAQTARQLVDVPISQWASDMKYLESPYYFSQAYLGIGYMTSGEHSDLSKTYSSDGILITGTLSARLNAYVDIAKDPYIFYLNNNTITGNTVFMLERLGVPPSWNDYFMSQPILKEFVRKTFYEQAGTTPNAKRGNKPGEALQDSHLSIIRGIYNTEINKVRKNEKKEATVLVSVDRDGVETWDYTVDENKGWDNITKRFSVPYLFAKAKNLAGGINTMKEYKESRLLDMIKHTNANPSQSKLSEMDYYTGQLGVLNLFLAWKDYAKTLGEGITASKFDVLGAKGGIVASMIEIDRKKDFEAGGLISGFSERFRDTMLGAYYLNGPILYRDLNRALFKFSFPFQGYQALIRGTDPTAVGGILKYSKIFNTYDDTVISRIFRDLKGIVYAKFKGQKYVKDFSDKVIIPQNLKSGTKAFGTTQEATAEVKDVLGPTPHSIDMIEAGFRTRTTRSKKELDKYEAAKGSPLEVGDMITQEGKSEDGTTKSIKTRITAIHPKGSVEFTESWDKEGWTPEGVKSIERYLPGAVAIEFEVVRPEESISLYKTPKEIEEIVYGEDGVVNRLFKYKSDKRFEHNFLLQYLEPERPIQARKWVWDEHGLQGQYVLSGFTPGFIKANKTGHKSGTDKNRLTQAWKDLLNHEDAAVRQFALDLYEASFIMSGFSPTLFSFNELFPTEIRFEAGIDQHMMKENVEIANSSLYFTPNDLSIFYKNNWYRSDIIPAATEKQIIIEPGALTVNGKNRYMNNVINASTGRLAYIKTKSKVFNLNERNGLGMLVAHPDKWVPYITYPNSITEELELYELSGVTENGEAIYIITEKLGYSKSGKVIKEFSNLETGLQNNVLDALSASIGTSLRNAILTTAGADIRYNNPFSSDSMLFSGFADSLLKAEVTPQVEAIIERTPEVPIEEAGRNEDTIEEGAQEEAVNNKLYVLDREDSIVFEEDQSSGYTGRTRKNASADATIAIAFGLVNQRLIQGSKEKLTVLRREEPDNLDIPSAGEKMTYDLVIGQNKLYIPVNLGNIEATSARIESIVKSLNTVGAETLNIAGNGIYTVKGKYTQQQLDKFVYELLEGVLKSPNLKIKIKSIRTGGQTGIDEAGAKAAINLGIPTTVLAPKGWKFRPESGKDISDEVAFKARFEEQAPEIEGITKIEFYQLAEQMKGYPKANKDLDKVMIDFLNKIGVKVKEESLQALRDRYNTDSLGVADIYNRIARVAKEERNINTLPEETSHFIVELLSGSNEILGNLKLRIKGWSGYNAVFNAYKDVYVNNDGTPDTERIEKEAMAKLISDAIVQKWNYKDKNWFYQKAREILNYVLEAFKTGKLFPIQAEANKIAEMLLDSNKNLIPNSKEEKAYIHAEKQTAKDILKLLEQFGITVNAYEPGVRDSVAYVNLARKYAKINPNDLGQVSDVGAQFFAEMLGYSHYFTTVYQELRKSPWFWKKYKEISADVSYMDKRKYKKTIIIDILKTLIRNKFNERFAKEKYGIIGEQILKIKNAFLLLLKQLSGANWNLIDSKMEDLLDRVLEGEDFIRTTIKEGRVQVTFQEALDLNPLGKDIITKIAALPGIILTGSIAYAPQGTVYRILSGLMHDIDLVSNYTPDVNERLLKSQYPDAEQVYDFTNSSGVDVDTYIVPTPGTRIIGIERRLNYKTQEKTGKLIAYSLQNKDTGEIVGTYELEWDQDESGKVTNEIEIKKGEQAILLDFFTNSSDRRIFKYEFEGSDNKRHPINLSYYEEPFEAKLDFSRFKDIWDFNRFVPFKKPSHNNQPNWVNLMKIKLDSAERIEKDQKKYMETESVFDKDLLIEGAVEEDSFYFQLNNKEIHKIVKDELSKARSKLGTSLFTFGKYGQIFASPNITRFSEQRNFVNNINRTKFNGTQVITLIKNPRNPNSSFWETKPANYKGPQLGLFEEGRMTPQYKCS